MHREHLGSRLGFILLSAGCAIGIGNVWKFPWMTGQYGGGAFVVIYLLFLLILGVPVLTMEFAMGRAAQKSPLKMYQALKPGGHWGWHGYVCLLGNVVLMMFYTTVAGWMLQYFVDTAAGRFVGLDVSGVETAFGSMLANPVRQTVYMGVIVISGFFIISIGVQKGLERVTKWMMMALIVLMLALAVHSLFLPGGSEGLKFYLLPDIQRLKDAGVGNVIVGALASVPWPSSAATSARITRWRASPSGSARWTRWWRFAPASLSSPPASPTAWTSRAAPR